MFPVSKGNDDLSEDLTLEAQTDHFHLFSESPADRLMHSLQIIKAMDLGSGVLSDGMKILV